MEFYPSSSQFFYSHKSKKSYIKKIGKQSVRAD